MVALTLVGGCARRPAPTPPDTAEAKSDPDFRAPPVVTAAERGVDGAILLTGRSRPAATISLAAPDGAVFGVPAAADGRWRLRLPAVATPRAFALSAAEDGRVLRGEGALLVAPAPYATAVLMRGGAPALPISAPGVGLRWASVDTDPGGGAAASGFAPPGTALRLSIDGVVQGEGTADAAGRFGVLWLGAPVPPGDHAVALITPGGGWSSRVTFGPADLAGRPVRIAAEPGGWRVDWAPPGGGVQTLHLLAPDSVMATVR